VRVEANLRRWIGLRDEVDELGVAFAALRATLPPDSLFSASIEGADRWIELVRAVGRFTAALARAGEETVALWAPGPTIAPGTRLEIPGGRLALSCRDPSPTLGPAFAEALASVSISATLAPTWFYRDRCGMAIDRVDEHEVASPFPPENRLVLVVGGVSTALQHRLRDRDAVAEILERTVAAVPGNLAIFFNSFEHLREVEEALPLADREVLRQGPAMDEGERTRLLDRMRDASAPRHRVLLGVLGGLFSEGVDLPGAALSAVIVVGPALPPPSFERQLLQEWYETRFGDGFTLAYVLPGMTRVAQAGGRVVRGPEDRGLVVLVCQRFLRHAWQRWLPSAWEPSRSRHPWEDAVGFFTPR
jgi:DNA excision repair protein ERCC-2